MYARNDIINAFEKKIFSYKEEKSEEKSENKSEKKSEAELKKYFDNIFPFLKEKSEGINSDLFTKYWHFLKPKALAKQLCEANDKKKINELVELIKVRWSNLKDEFEKMSKEEMETEMETEIKY